MSPRDQIGKDSSFEQLEQRLVLSAQPLADFYLHPLEDPRLAQDSGPVEVQSLDAWNNQAMYVHQQFGFTGTGQTVAIIDSGIAWDHYALGGGFGPGYNVVGGWDFAENDADPYDDGPAGFHGTHVSGIVASQDATYRGVAPGADLVSLRVFNDSGAGYFQWVEKALQWVHQHRNDFANPITTVNLSLGAQWNSNGIPQWANLEDEFAQLSADDIFVSVAAGNDFQQYLQKGLSYPAASPHVVPVASHDVQGALSDFSQRNERVLVAPGQSIGSTVPDHLFGGQQSGQFLGASGTSMAAPYVAASSALLREAFAYVGIEGVTPLQLYNHLRQTSDLLFDNITQIQYHRINLQRAIEALLVDEHGDTPAAGSNLGVLADSRQIAGVLGSKYDSDFFRFVAASDGSVTLRLDQGNLANYTWILPDGSLVKQQLTVSFDVMAGKQYSFGLRAPGSGGHYQIQLDIDAAPIPNLGKIYAKSVELGAINQQGWFKLVAGRTGLLSLQTTANDAGIQLQVYDQSFQQLGQSAKGTGRVDIAVKADQTYLVRAVGSTQQLGVVIQNLVSLKGRVLTVHGTSGFDHVVAKHGAGFSVTSGSISYQLDTSQFDMVRFLGHGAGDRWAFYGTATDDHALLTPGDVHLTSGPLQMMVRDFATVIVRASGGLDSATFLDSPGNDHFSAGADEALMVGAGYSRLAVGFEWISAQSQGGADRAELHGTSGNDQVIQEGSQVQLHVGSLSIYTSGFNETTVHAGSGGSDRAWFHGTAAADAFELRPGYGQLSSASTTVVVDGFTDLRANANGASDSIQLFGSKGADQLVGQRNLTQLSGNGFALTASQFSNVVAHSSGGIDKANLIDTAGNETFDGNAWRSILQGADYSIKVVQFSKVSASASSGMDAAKITGTWASDMVLANQTSVALHRNDLLIRASGFDSIELQSNGGVDEVYLTGSAAADWFYYANSQFQFSVQGTLISGSQFSLVRVVGGGGTDQAYLAQMDSNDRLWGSHLVAESIIDDAVVRLLGFAWLDAYAEDGQTPINEIGAVDFWYQLHGTWTE